jgi:hypothetical protein
MKGLAASRSSNRNAILEAGAADALPPLVELLIDALGAAQRVFALPRHSIEKVEQPVFPGAAFRHLAEPFVVIPPGRFKKSAQIKERQREHAALHE